MLANEFIVASAAAVDADNVVVELTELVAVTVDGIVGSVDEEVVVIAFEVETAATAAAIFASNVCSCCGCCQY